MIEFFLLGGMATAATLPNSAIVSQSCDAGEIYAFTRAACQIAVTNTGHSRVRIHGVRAAIAGDEARPAELSLGTGEQGYIQLTLRAGNSVGNERHAIRFTTDERGSPEGTGAGSAFVMSLLDDAKPELDFGVIDTHVAAQEKRLEFTSHDVADLRATSILEAPDWVEAGIDADGRTIRATVKPGAQWGLHVGFVKVALATKEQPEAWVEVKADIHGDVVPASNPVDMGLMRIGNKNEFRVPLRNRFGHAFDVGNLKLEGIRGSVAVKTCEHPDDTCRMLEIKVDEENAGPLKGEVIVGLPTLHQQVSVRLWGLLVPPDLKVKTIDPNTGRVPSGGSSASAGLDLNKAVREAVKNSENVTPPGTGPLLRWKIANGAAIHGFQIFRGHEENGPFILLNKPTIPSKAQTQDAVEYSWRDTSATPGKTYWYSIGIVYNDGRKQQLTGPHPVVAK